MFEDKSIRILNVSTNKLSSDQSLSGAQNEWDWGLISFTRCSRYLMVAQDIGDKKTKIRFIKAHSSDSNNSKMHVENYSINRSISLNQ